MVSPGSQTGNDLPVGGRLVAFWGFSAAVIREIGANRTYRLRRITRA
jgi:hypothetical protein